jgi:hypothetical protein
MPAGKAGKATLVLEERPLRPGAGAHTLHSRRVKSNPRSRVAFGYDHGVDGAQRVADGAAGASLLVHLMLEVAIWNGIDGAKATATAAVGAQLLVDAVVELGLHADTGVCAAG